MIGFIALAVYLLGLGAGMLWLLSQPKDPEAPDRLPIVFLWPVVAVFIGFYLLVEHCSPGGWDNDPPSTGPE